MHMKYTRSSRLSSRSIVHLKKIDVTGSYILAEFLMEMSQLLELGLNTQCKYTKEGYKY